MSATIYLSRAFVEFGPFAPDEIVAFKKRGLLREIDHIRNHGKDDWIPLATWLASLAPPFKSTITSAKEPVAKKATAKKASEPAKKSGPSKKGDLSKKSGPCEKGGDQESKMRERVSNSPLIC